MSQRASACVLNLWPAMIGSSDSAIKLTQALIDQVKQTADVQLIVGDRPTASTANGRSTRGAVS
jgi:hypothetical protein